MTSNILKSFYTCTVENIRTGSITAWFGNSTASNRKALQRVVRTASHIVGGELPFLQDIYTMRCMRKAQKIVSDFSHQSHRLFSLLPSGKCFRSIRSRTSQLRDSVFPQGNEQPELIQLTYVTIFSTYIAIHALYLTQHFLSTLDSSQQHILHLLQKHYTAYSALHSLMHVIKRPIFPFSIIFQPHAERRNGGM